MDNIEEEYALEASKNAGLEPDNPAEMAGVYSAVDLFGDVEDPHITLDHNSDCEEANDEIRDRASFHDIPHTTDKKLSLGTTFGEYGI